MIAPAVDSSSFNSQQLRTFDNLISVLLQEDNHIQQPGHIDRHNTQRDMATQLWQMFAHTQVHAEGWYFKHLLHFCIITLNTKLYI